MKKKKYRLDELLAEVPPGALYEETDWGPDVGNEIIDDDSDSALGARDETAGSPGEPEAERVVFMDWEFTDLGRVGVQCLPLSVGMATPEGESLYLEFVELGPYNDFVRSEVVPHMTMAGRVTLDEAKSRLASWLASQGTRIVIAADSEYDSKMLRWVVPDLAALGTIRLVNILDDLTLGHFKVDESMRGKLRLEFNDAVEAWFLRNRKPKHHALYDAVALREGWTSIRG